MLTRHAKPKRKRRAQLQLARPTEVLCVCSSENDKNERVRSIEREIRSTERLRVLTALLSPATPVPAHMYVHSTVPRALHTTQNTAFLAFHLSHHYILNHLRLLEPTLLPLTLRLSPSLDAASRLRAPRSAPRLRVAARNVVFHEEAEGLRAAKHGGEARPAQLLPSGERLAGAIDDVSDVEPLRANSPVYFRTPGQRWCTLLAVIAVRKWVAFVNGHDVSMRDPPGTATTLRCRRIGPTLSSITKAE